MERGAIDVDGMPGGLDLQATLESGQSYVWRREDGGTYGEGGVGGGDAWYATVVGGAVVRARQVDGHLEWESTTDAEPVLRRLLRLDDDLRAIRDATASDPVVEAAWDAHWGMRLVRDPPWPTLVSFICSAQMQLARIHRIQLELARAFGDVHTLDGETYHAFPTPAQLAAASEDALRELGAGYRAPYLIETARMVAEGEAHPGDVAGEPYEDARATLTEFVGVGEKVADCVLLFSLGYLEAVPLDTWIRKTIDRYFPDCDRGNYAETSRAIRERLGGEYAGYAQTYVFHYLRNGGEVPAEPPASED